jgi:hypothetical protein
MARSHRGYLGGAAQRRPGGQVTRLQPGCGRGQRLQVAGGPAGAEQAVGHPGPGRDRQGGEHHRQVMLAEEHAAAHRADRGGRRGRGDGRGDGVLAGGAAASPPQQRLQRQPDHGHGERADRPQPQHHHQVGGRDADQGGDQDTAGQPARQRHGGRQRAGPRPQTPHAPTSGTGTKR